MKTRINPAEARRLRTDDLDARISALSHDPESATLGILLNERDSRIEANRRKLDAIDALWNEFGIDCDDVRKVSGGISYRANGIYVHTQGGATRSSKALLWKQSGNARTRRWFGGSRDGHAFDSPEEALLAGLREGFVPSPTPSL